MSAAIDAGAVNLVPLDGSLPSEQAIRHVQALAAETDQVVLVRVVPVLKPLTGPLGEVTVPPAEILQLARRTATGDLERAADRLRATHPKLRIEPVIEVGDPAERILAVARDRRATLIVMASRGWGASGRATFGSVADRLARTAATPMLIIRPDDDAIDLAPARIRRLVVPLDGSELARRAVTASEQLARRLDIPIHLVSVIDVAHARHSPPSLDDPANRQRYDELLGDARLDAQLAVEQAGARLLRTGIAATWSVRSGSAALSITELCCDGDLLVMTSHGRSGGRRWQLGSVAEKLVREGPVPVLLLRVDDSRLADAALLAASPAGTWHLQEPDNV